MKIKSLAMLVVGLLLLQSLFGQQNKPLIVFTEKVFDFGTFTESEGIVTHDFRFTNEGKIPLILNEVTASCGCTVPEWPREPVLPGKSAVISVKFDPKNQSGSFSKSVQVHSNAEPAMLSISIKGVVIPSEKVEEVYKYTIGYLRLQTIYAAFGEIIKGKTAVYTIKVFNTSTDKQATISFRQPPANIKIHVIPEIIDPQQEGRIELEYLTTVKEEWDYVVHRLTMLINGQTVPNNRISVTANIKEDFSAYSAEDMAKAPRVVFDTTTFDFGTIANNKSVEHSFRLTNIGKSDLFIRKVTASCGCTAVQPEKIQIPPGESTLIKAVFNPAGRNGKQKKAITVITNDPKRSKSILWISCTVGESGNLDGN